MHTLLHMAAGAVVGGVVVIFYIFLSLAQGTRW